LARILLADDDDGVRRFVSRALAHFGHDVVEAEDGGLAMDIVTDEVGRFDLLLSDVKMPVMDGIALATDVAMDYPDLPILLMTGFADQRERADRLNSIVYDVILKPFSMADIIAKVEDALENRPVEVFSLARLVV
jgi:two-component system cell cycle response regulator CpdR